MIDTIILTIPNADKLIWEPDRFTPSLRGVRDNAEKGFGARLFMKYTQNINSKHGYYPRLTVTPRWDNGLQIPLKIEFSIPKLIFGNNLDEVCDSDWDLIVATLQKKLSEMGIKIFTANLENAPVSAVHYSKNVVLSKHITATSAIKTLSKLDVSKKLDINNRHFQNEGHALYFDCGSYQLVFYDKLQDITKNKRQAVDKDKTQQQLDLFEYITEHKIPLEVLRFEIRLTKKVLLNSLFSKLGLPINPTFKQVFSQEVSQKVINYYWSILKENNSFLLKFGNSDSFKQVVDYQKSAGKKLNAIETLGVAQILDYSKAYGLRNLKNMVTSLYSQRTWYRLGKYFDKITEMTGNFGNYQFVNDMENAFNSPEPYRVEIPNGNLLKLN